MTNNLNEQVETNQTNQTNEATPENTQVPPSIVNIETPTPPTPPTQKANLMHKYPHLWKYLTTGVLSFIAGMLVFSFASSLKQNHRHDRALEMTQQMPTKSNKGQRQAPTRNQSPESTQPTQSTTTEKTI